MKHKLLAIATASMAAVALLVSCKNSETAPEKAMPNGEFIYNVPCKVVNIHQELDGQSILFLWLHGGVHDVAKHDLFVEYILKDLFQPYIDFIAIHCYSFR